MIGGAGTDVEGAVFTRGLRGMRHLLRLGPRGTTRFGLLRPDRGARHAEQALASAQLLLQVGYLLAEDVRRRNGDRVHASHLRMDLQGLRVAMAYLALI